jgi:non-specific serine/threonine protein kinase
MLQPALSYHHGAAVRRAQEAMPPGGYAAEFAKGAAMNPGGAIAFALGEPARLTPRPAIRRTGHEPQLTHREHDVAALVTQGLSNSQIAARLVISVRTVESHVQHIMDKLGVSTRGQIAVWSAAQPPAP